MDPGDLPALVIDGRRPPDRRQISARWLTGTFLTGFTSCTLMGIALFAALDGRQKLATPPALLMMNDDLARSGADDGTNGQKGDRLALTLPRQNFEDRRQFELSTEQKNGDTTIIRTHPFELIHMSLAEERSPNLKYPKFNALDLFADGPVTAATQPAQIYGNKVESEISLKTSDFDASSIPFDPVDQISAEDAEKIVRRIGYGISDGTHLDMLRYIDPAQYGTFNSPFSFSNAPEVTIVQENVSIAMRAAQGDGSESYAEDIIPISRKETVLKALLDANYDESEARKIANALTAIRGSDSLDGGYLLRIGIEVASGQPDRLVRASIYKGLQHVVSIALNDHQRYVRSAEPEMTPVLREVFAGGIPVTRVPFNRLPTVYDAVYRSVLTYNLPQETAHQLVRILATDVDLQSRVNPDDSLEIFYPLNKNKEAPNNHDILYVSANFGGVVRKYYRHQSADGTVDYYDSQGRISKQFLLRKPVPNGIFRSPFGERRHPILGYVRMHTGVDWAAPRGSPIIAAGDGVVIKAGPMGGYGNHTEIQHANGYVTSYSHQNGFAPGIKPGVRVKQGQVIGYIGSSGLSTGPHCHFEVIVNGTKVDPMRVRIPDNKALKGKELIAFKHDRDRIDGLISGQGDTKIASSAKN